VARYSREDIETDALAANKRKKEKKEDKGKGKEKENGKK